MDFVPSCECSLKRTSFHILSAVDSISLFSVQAALHTLHRGVNPFYNSQNVSLGYKVNLASSENKHKDQHYRPSVQICLQLTLSSTRSVKAGTLNLQHLFHKQAHGPPAQCPVINKRKQAIKPSGPCVQHYLALENFKLSHHCLYFPSYFVPVLIFLSFLHCNNSIELIMSLKIVK